MLDDEFVDDARAELTAIAARLAQRYPDTNTGRGVTAVRLHDELVGDVVVASVRHARVRAIPLVSSAIIPLVLLTTATFLVRAYRLAQGRNRVAPRQAARRFGRNP